MRSCILFSCLLNRLETIDLLTAGVEVAQRRTLSAVKDIRAKIFLSRDFFEFYGSRIMSYLCQKYNKKLGSLSSFQR